MTHRLCKSNSQIKSSHESIQLRAYSKTTRMRCARYVRAKCHHSNTVHAIARYVKVTNLTNMSQNSADEINTGIDERQDPWLRQSNLLAYLCHGSSCLKPSVHCDNFLVKLHVIGLIVRLRPEK